MTAPEQPRLAPDERPYGPPPALPPVRGGLSQPSAYVQPVTPYAQPATPYPKSGAPARRPAFPHPEPRPYHLMLRTWTYAWWRPAVGLPLLLAGFLVVLPLALMPVLLLAAAAQGDSASEAFDSLGGQAAMSPASLLYLNLMLASLIVWTWLLVRVLHQLRPRWLASVRPRLRWTYLFACLGLALVALIAQFMLGLVLPGDDANADVSAEPNSMTGRTVAMLLIVLVTTPLQAAGEEYAFRGYLLQGLGALLRHRWVTIVATALLFAVAHWQFDPPLFLDRFLFGLVAAWLVIRTGGLEAGIALHVVNNYFALTFAIIFADLDSALDPIDVSWWNLPLSITQSVVFALLAAWLAARLGLQTTTRPPQEGQEPPPAAPPEEQASVLSAR